jgi:hypothetical protein
MISCRQLELVNLKLPLANRARLVPPVHECFNGNARKKVRNIVRWIILNVPTVVANEKKLARSTNFSNYITKPAQNELMTVRFDLRESTF